MKTVRVVASAAAVLVLLATLPATAGADDTGSAGPDGTSGVQYDHAQRLENAWTDGAGSTCPSTIPAAVQTDGSDGYRVIYTYSPNHRFVGAVEGVTYKSYLYGDPRHVHAPTGYDGVTYTYDANGQVATRDPDGAGPATPETFQFNPLGWLETHDAGGPGKTSSITYDANGTRLTALQAGPTATRVLHLPMIDVADPDASTPGSALTVTRRYGNGAVRVNGVLSWQVNDHQGSPHTTIADGAAIPTAQSRRQLPYGEERTTPNSPLTPREFLDAPTTGDTDIVHLGARQYDPHLRHFLSVDPLAALNEPMVNGYQYGDLTPITRSDPSGLFTLGMEYDPYVGLLSANQIGQWQATDPEGFEQHRRDQSTGSYGTARDPYERCWMQGCEEMAAGDRWTPYDWYRDMYLAPGMSLFDALAFMPVVGDVIDLVDFAIAIVTGDFREAGVIAALALLPGSTRVSRSFIGSVSKDLSWLAPSPTAGSIRNVNPLGGTQNCVNCVIATDARLAGRPASALNSSGPQPISILESHFGGAFKPVAGRAEIESILSSSGHGSRGIVFGGRGADPGHVFNAVNQNGVIRFLDGQTGRTASFNGFSEFFFLPTS